MKWLLFAGGLLLLCSCSLKDMTWTDYHVSRHALRVAADRSEVLGCEELGTVSGKSSSDVGSAKEKAISEAVLLGANYLLFDEVETDVNERNAYLAGSTNIMHVYGTAYKCGE